MLGHYKTIPFTKQIIKPSQHAHPIQQKFIKAYFAYKTSSISLSKPFSYYHTTYHSKRLNRLLISIVTAVRLCYLLPTVCNKHHTIKNPCLLPQHSLAGTLENIIVTNKGILNLSDWV